MLVQTYNTLRYSAPRTHTSLQVYVISIQIVKHYWARILRKYETVASLNPHIFSMCEHNAQQLTI